MIKEKIEKKKDKKSERKKVELKLTVTKFKRFDKRCSSVWVRLGKLSVEKINLIRKKKKHNEMTNLKISSLCVGEREKEGERE